MPAELGSKVVFSNRQFTIETMLPPVGPGDYGIAVYVGEPKILTHCKINVEVQPSVYFAPANQVNILKRYVLLGCRYGGGEK